MVKSPLQLKDQLQQKEDYLGRKLEVEEQKEEEEKMEESQDRGAQ